MVKHTADFRNFSDFRLQICECFFASEEILASPNTNKHSYIVSGQDFPLESSSLGRERGLALGDSRGLLPAILSSKYNDMNRYYCSEIQAKIMGLVEVMRHELKRAHKANTCLLEQLFLEEEPNFIFNS